MQICSQIYIVIKLYTDIPVLPAVSYARDLVMRRNDCFADY